MLDIIKCNKAEIKRELASLDLMEAVRSEFPMGLLCSVVMGGYTIKVEITGYNKYWWSGPGIIFGRNVKTGKIRKFYHSNIIL